MSSNIRITRICQFCSKEFTAKTVKTKFCSLECSSKSYKKRSRERKIESSNRETESVRNLELEQLKKLDFLNVQEACLLMGVSRRTFYRVISTGDLTIAKIGRRTIIKRSELDKFFEGLHTSHKMEQEGQKFPGIENCYSIGEAQKRFNISSGALYNIIKGQGIPKYNAGKHVYVAKRDLDLIFNI